MSQIKGKNTKPEILVRQYLYAHGFRYRLHVKDLPGKPDIVLPKYKIAILINGCFWHGHHGCKYYVVPKTRTEFWQQKINGNIANDEKAILALQEKGYKVIVIWECELKKNRIEETLQQLVAELSKN